MGEDGKNLRFKSGTLNNEIVFISISDSCLFEPGATVLGAQIYRNKRYCIWRIAAANTGYYSTRYLDWAAQLFRSR